MPGKIIVAPTMRHDQFMYEMLTALTGTYIGNLWPWVRRFCVENTQKMRRRTYEYMVIMTRLQHTLMMLIGYPHFPKSKFGRGGRIPRPRHSTTMIGVT